MGTPDTPAPLRRLAAPVSLAVTSATFLAMGVQEQYFSSARWGLWGIAALTGAASFAMLRRSVMAQVLARGAAWVALLPSGFAVLADLAGAHRPDLSALAIASSSAAALVLGRKALDTPEARREFSPVAYRGWFLAGAVSAVTAALVAGFGAGGEVLWGSSGQGVQLAALAAVMLAVAAGVVRMRAWGVLLGAVTSVFMLGAAMLARHELTAIASGLAALPGMLLVAPLVAARLRPLAPVTQPVATAPARVAAAITNEPRIAASGSPPMRPRVAGPDVVEPGPEWETSGRARHSRS
jgi:hypothetical protein